MKAIGVAFAWTMILATILGMLVGLLLVQVGYNFWIGPGVTLGLSLVDGWIQARSLLAKRLGHKDRTSVVSTSRLIPATFESILGRRNSEVELTDVIAIRTPSGDIIEDRVIREFVWKAIARYEAKRPPFSRRYWLENYKPRMTREAYESIMDVLRQNSLITGRQQGRSGRISTSYDIAIKKIRG